MVNSINKGKDFERECVHLLEKTTGITGFHRVPCSGGFATHHKTSDQKFDGDIFFDYNPEKKYEEPLHEILGKYYKDLVIECKTTKDTLTMARMLSDISIFSEWKKQAKEEAKGRDWVLLFRYFHSPIFACSDNPDVLERIGIQKDALLTIKLKEDTYYIQEMG